MLITNNPFLKPVLGVLLCLSSGISIAQGYWQQEVEYDINVDFDHVSHQFEGEQNVKYTNNSPDTLHQVFFHLYFNAFQPGSMMDARSQSVEDPDPRIGDRISKLKDDEIGYHRVSKLKQDGKKLAYQVVGTIMEVDLSEPILPGKSTDFSMEYIAQVPIQIRRSGRHNFEGIDYTMTQWYPKLAEYDRDGWHSNPYVGREFHGVFGTYNVKITIDSSFTLAGTGVVQNVNDVGHGYSTNKKDSPRLEWQFTAENVHDFAWAADPEYRHLRTTLDNGTVVRFFHRNDTNLNANWQKLIPYTEKMFKIMNEKFGEYPYPEFSVIQGGDGGMEYPMCTMITTSGTFNGLISVTVHEAIHNWYYGVLASNELKYPWMDEGFTTFAQNIVLDSLHQKGKQNKHQRSYNGYIQNARSGREEPLTTLADNYHSNGAYGANAYSKGCLTLAHLEHIVGTKAFYNGMKNYWNLWKFKHPTPTDFKRCIEKSSRMELDWFFEYWIGTTKTIDYEIGNVFSFENKSEIEINRLGGMPMPIEVLVDHEGKQRYYYIPLEIMRGQRQIPINRQSSISILEDWPYTYPTYVLKLDFALDASSRITIDPQSGLADIDRGNNEFPRSKIQFHGE
ncbi:MAG: M1 family metallopeptidase [Flavobacteriales bacterium]|jgi:hypothetical protein|nr:M1 family metallopeptidase [Flavobacteriales bacterium]MBT4703878.1 M1 family metallopeptidase [Flavobacteriales bacterium]MBT4931067.1 M1 family metallopeptidase [Flavobacteriales bacterium]MBT5133525.1 M1 family metallopeptidase [Flavobacteriales bacterium]MBT5977222.1 M1 family metallopeptidase [Flavobacteriales bacterium]